MTSSVACAFMTMCSANTFVVWGGMAYEHGLVVILVNLCYGVAALLAGYTVAGKWKRLAFAPRPSSSSAASAAASCISTRGR